MTPIFEDHDPSFDKDDLFEVAKKAAAPAPALAKPPAEPQAAPKPKPNLFLEGDRVLNTMRDLEGKVISIKSDTHVFVDYGSGPQITSVGNLKLLHKGTDVQQALRNDPEALTELAEHYLATNGRIEISGSPSSVDKLVEGLSSVSSLTPTQAVDYVKPTTELSHGGKFDILVGDNIPEGLAQRLGVFNMKGQRARAGETQINSRALAEWLMKNYNVLPKKWQ